MKKIVLELKDPSPEIASIFKFVVKNQFDDSTTLIEIRKKIKEKFEGNFSKLSQEEIIHYIKTVKDFDFYSDNNYKQKTGDTDPLYEMMNALSKFKCTLIVFIEKKYQTNRKSYLTERQVLPRIEASKTVDLI